VNELTECNGENTCRVVLPKRFRLMDEVPFRSGIAEAVHTLQAIPKYKTYLVDLLRKNDA